MKILTIQEAYLRKFRRQDEVPGLELHASGHCAHIGKLSPGCRGCFIANRYRWNFSCGIRCDLECPYCFGGGREAEQPREAVKAIRAALMRDSLAKDYDPASLSFTGGGEPLLYMDFIEEVMGCFREAEKRSGKRPWYYLYTNGLLMDDRRIAKLEDLGFDEIRFHLGATDFSERVYKNMKNAAAHFRTITVETPSWPPHRKKLFEMLPRIEEIGVKHVNLAEVEVRPDNYGKISKILPDAEIYQCSGIYLDDGGLVYDIMKEVVRKGYHYSVLDCNCFVKDIQRGPGKWVCHETIGALCAGRPPAGKKRRHG